MLWGGEVVIIVFILFLIIYSDKTLTELLTQRILGSGKNILALNHENNLINILSDESITPSLNWVLNILENKEYKSTKTTVPFLKNNEFDYSDFIFWIDEEKSFGYGYIVFIFFVILIISAVSKFNTVTAPSLLGDFCINV